MKKSSFVAMVLGTISGVLFSLGMCMALLPEWNAMTEGIILGAGGLVLALITLLVWRRMENKIPIKLNGKIVALTVYGALSAIIFGVGLCLCLVGESFIAGTTVGLVGIVMLLALIPMIKGIK